jgi:hypothetical protein
VLFTALVLLGLPANAAALMTGSDWNHSLDVIAKVNATPPDLPLVVLLGGSAARECTVSDESWAADVAAQDGPAVVTYNLGSRNQTFYEDVAFVKAMPQVPTIVYIAVNLGRFTSPYTTKVVPMTPDPDQAARHKQHHYTQSRILSLAEKKRLVRDWLIRRYPVFQQRFKYNVGQLDRLIRACLRRGLHPVLVDMPRNIAVIGHALDRPMQRYRKASWTLADKYDIPFLNFVRAAALVNRDFHDLSHLVEPGWPKFQRLLAGNTVGLLKRYGMTPPVYDATPPAQSEPAAAPTPAPDTATGP